MNDFYLIQPDALALLQSASPQVIQAARRGPSRPMQTRGETRDGAVRINITGVLTKRRDPVADALIGNTSYPEVIAQLEATKGTEIVELFVDSPGGAVAGLFEAIEVIESMRSKRLFRVIAANAHSAAYALSAAAGVITSTSRGSMFGSVGVALPFVKNSRVGWVTNTDSPYKRPNPETAEGRAVIQKQLDAISGLFVEAIARGRGTSAERVKSDFGRGMSFIAQDALSRGMIDEVGTAGISKAGGLLSIATELERQQRLKARRPQRSQGPGSLQRAQSDEAFADQVAELVERGQRGAIR